MSQRYTTAPSRAGEELGIKPGRAVAEHRHSALDAMDLFPTPPWATRALAEIVLPQLGLSLRGADVWEPACGLGHMAEVLGEYADRVFASDVCHHGYDRTGRIGSFVGEGPDVIAGPGVYDFIISNPPFKLAEAFIAAAMAQAECVAMLMRTSFLESAGRYERVFKPTPPIAVAQFCERVPMHEGRWEPEGSTATAYAWFVWLRGAHVETRLMWIPPGQRTALERHDDRARFAGAPSP